MSSDLLFMMGQFEARFPADRSYCKNHMWAVNRGDGTIRFGFTAYAVRLLQDVYFLDWEVAPETRIRHRQEIGSIESKKAESSLFAPMSGVLTQLNERLLDDPSAINVDKYAGGWLFEMLVEDASLLSPAEYVEHLAAVWEVTQRTIKGQVNK